MKKLEGLLVFILLAGFAEICFKSQRWVSVTVDEFAHLPAGYYYWLTGDYRLYGKNPPLVKLIASLPLVWSKPNAEMDLSKLPRSGWLPWFYGTDFMLKNRERYLKIFEQARLMVILMAVILGLILYLYARSFYGKAGALLSLLVFVLCPNLIAHSQMATVDTGASLFIFLAVLSLIFYLKNPSWLRASLAGLGLGLAELAKFSALSLLFFYALVPLLLLWPFKKDKPKLSTFALRLSQVGLMILLWIFLTALCYRFQGLFKPIRNFEFQSVWMKRVQKYSAPLPAPFPKSYLYGLDGQMRDVEAGEFGNYLLGNWYFGVDHRYFLICLLVKVPIPIQILFLLAIFSGLRRKKTGLGFVPEEILLLAIMGWIFFLFSFKNSLQIGIRYLLPTFPLAFLLMGRMGKNFSGSSFFKKLVVAGLMIWLLGENFYIYPHYLSYFNELSLKAVKYWPGFRIQLGGGPKNGHKILLDSNLDWGQDLPALADFMKKNQIDKIELWYFGNAQPELYGINYQLLGEEPRLKYSAISAQYYYSQGKIYYPLLYYQPEQTLLYHKNPIVLNREKIRPYLNQTPVASAGYSILVFKND